MGSRVPGDLLLSPVALVALGIVLVNDRVLKVDHPSVLSGKLSDLAGLVYFPLFAVAAVEAVRRLHRPDWQLRWSAVVQVALVTGAVFVAVKWWAPAAAVYRPAVGAAVWPLQAAARLLGGGGLPPLAPAPLVMDRSDLLALPMLVLPVLVARRVMDVGAAGERAGPDDQSGTCSAAQRAHRSLVSLIRSPFSSASRPNRSKPLSSHGIDRASSSISSWWRRCTSASRSR